MGQPTRLTLATRDRFGNACASGGEDVDVELRGLAGGCSSHLLLRQLKVPFDAHHVCPLHKQQVWNRGSLAANAPPQPCSSLHHQPACRLAPLETWWFRSVQLSCSAMQLCNGCRCWLLEGLRVRQWQWHICRHLQGRPRWSLGHRAKVSLKPLDSTCHMWTHRRRRPQCISLMQRSSGA